MVEKFCVDDYVVAIRDIDDRVPCGTTGKIWEVHEESREHGNWLCIEWDADVGGHTGDGSRPDGHCWNVYAENVTHMCHEIPDSECDTSGIDITKLLFG